MPPAPWVDLGWIDNFARWYETPTDVVRSGAKALATAQYRGPLEARVEFDFRQWGKLQMALAGGSEHMNVLTPASGSVTPAASGGTPAAAIAVLAGSTANELLFGTGVTSAFAAGQLIAVDVDYEEQTGYVGSGIPAAYVNSAAAVNEDPNYVRRVTFNVGRIGEVTSTSVLLEQPLGGGPPLAGASAQVVMAFVDREGGSFFQEWSALFVAETESGGRVCFYYPRLSRIGWASAWEVLAGGVGGDCQALFSDCAEGFVCGAGLQRYERWTERVVLPELFSGGDGGGLLSVSLVKHL